MKTVGFIGTGGMGSGMAANLIKAGYRLVVNDLNRAQAKTLEAQGAEFKDSPKAVAESCEIVLSMLPHNDAVKAVGLGKGGLAEATAVTASLCGSIESTISHDSATALGESANCAPCASSPLACARLRSFTTRR